MTVEARLTSSQFVDRIKLTSGVQTAVWTQLDQPVSPYQNLGVSHAVRPGMTTQYAPMPFFTTDSENRAPITPARCPPFIRFPHLAGTLQGLNSSAMWLALLQSHSPMVKEEVLPAIHEDNIWAAAGTLREHTQGVYDPLLVMLGAGLVYGSKLHKATSQSDKSLRGYYPVMSAVGGYRRIVSSPDELRERIVEQLGQTGKTGKVVSYARGYIPDLPFPSLLESVLQSAGDYVRDDEHWEHLAEQILK